MKAESGEQKDMTLEVFESENGQSKVVATNPDLKTIETVIRGLSWKEITFVTLKIDEQNHLEASGILNPEDGLCAIVTQNGVSRFARPVPERLDQIVALLQSYRNGDGRWEKMFRWVEPPP
jgi:hypothetical protein